MRVCVCAAMHPTWGIFFSLFPISALVRPTFFNAPIELVGGSTPSAEQRRKLQAIKPFITSEAEHFPKWGKTVAQYELFRYA